MFSFSNNLLMDLNYNCLLKMIDNKDILELFNVIYYIIKLILTCWESLQLSNNL